MISFRDDRWLDALSSRPSGSERMPPPAEKRGKKPHITRHDKPQAGAPAIEVAVCIAWPRRHCHLRHDERRGALMLPMRLWLRQKHLFIFYRRYFRSLGDELPFADAKRASSRYRLLSMMQNAKIIRFLIFSLRFDYTPTRRHLVA